MHIPLTFSQKLNNYLDAHLSEGELTLKLSKALHLSYYQIYRKIKKETGKTPTGYIRQKRLEAAFDWIQQTDYSISQIAYSVGFNNLAYFSRSFTRHYGFPPSDLRRTKKKCVQDERAHNSVN